MVSAAGRMQRVRESPRGRLPLRVVLLFCLVLAAAIACIWTQQQTSVTAYALRRAHDNLTAAETDHARLLQGLATMRSPQRLELQAPRFKLAEPKPEQVYRVPR